MTCPLCVNPEITFYDLMKDYCSNQKKIDEDVCGKHRETYGWLATDFTLGFSASKFVEDLKVDGAFFDSIHDDGAGVFLSHNYEEAEKMLSKIKEYRKDSIRWHLFLAYLGELIDVSDIPFTASNNDIDLKKLFSKIKDWKDTAEGV